MLLLLLLMRHVWDEIPQMCPSRHCISSRRSREPSHQIHMLVTSLQNQYELKKGNCSYCFILHVVFVIIDLSFCLRPLKVFTVLLPLVHSASWHSRIASCNSSRSRFCSSSNCPKRFWRSGHRDGAPTYALEKAGVPRLHGPPVSTLTVSNSSHCL